MVERARRRPRITVLNIKYVKDVWGDAGKKEINTPRLINDYNHYMGGVDVSDQRIAYYHPNPCCHYNWVPIFMQILSIMHNNTYVVHKGHYGKNTLSHKRFTMEWVRLCTQKAHLAIYENIDSEASVSTTASYSTNTNNILCKCC
eukprot:5360646-Ditylum_brightwellii.AAC.1